MDRNLEAGKSKNREVHSDKGREIEEGRVLWPEVRTQVAEMTERL